MKYRKNGAYIWIILAVAAFALLLSGCKRDKRLTTELDAVSLGIDVARYQGTIDWELVAQENIGFAIVRVGYRTMADGIITEDSNGRYNLQEARNAGIPLGMQTQHPDTQQTPSLDHQTRNHLYLLKYRFP